MIGMYTERDRLVLVESDGTERRFDMHADRGEVMFMACGAGENHVHYIAFQYRMYVLSADKRYLTQLGCHKL